MLLGAGREAEIFAHGEDRVLRLAREGEAAAAERDAVVLAAAAAAGAPVPSVHERVVVDGRTGFVLDRLGGGDLLTEVARRPWRVGRVAATLGRLHAEVHRLPAPTELPALHDELSRRLEDEAVPADVREIALAALARLPAGDRLCHGDFHPGNVLRGPHGPAVIDWSGAVRGHPSADVARTRLLIERGTPPGEPPTVVRLAGAAGRRVLLGGYLRAYRRRLPLDDALVARWEPVMAAVRLVERIEPEREGLLSLARL